MSLFGTNSHRIQTGLNRLSKEISLFWQRTGFATPVAYQSMSVMINIGLLVLSFIRELLSL